MYLLNREYFHDTTSICDLCGCMCVELEKKLKRHKIIPTRGYDAFNNLHLCEDCDLESKRINNEEVKTISKETKISNYIFLLSHITRLPEEYIKDYVEVLLSVELRRKNSDIRSINYKLVREKRYRYKRELEEDILATEDIRDDLKDILKKLYTVDIQDNMISEYYDLDLFKLNKPLLTTIVYELEWSKKRENETLREIYYKIKKQE